MKAIYPFVLLFLPTVVFGVDCDSYPYSDGINVEDVAGGTKILATSGASVSFDDIDAIRDAKDEAILLAKAAISKFLSEQISSDESIAKAVNETKSMQGTEKENTRKEVIERVKTLRNSSQALLRGVVVLGDCYTKGKEVRVSVGLKPETIKSAGTLAGETSKSLSVQPTPQTGNVPSQPSSSAGQSVTSGSTSSSTPLQGVESHSNTERLKNF